MRSTSATSTRSPTTRTGAGQQRLFGRTPLSPSERARRELQPALATEVHERYEAALEQAVPDDRYVPRPPSVPSVVYERLRPARSFAEWRARAHAARQGEGPKVVVIDGVSFIVRPIRLSDGDRRVIWD